LIVFLKNLETNVVRQTHKLRSRVKHVQIVL